MGDMKTVTRQHGSNLQLACFRFMHISGCIHFEVLLLAAGWGVRDDRSSKRRRGEIYSSSISIPMF